MTGPGRGEQSQLFQSESAAPAAFFPRILLLHGRQFVWEEFFRLWKTSRFFSARSDTIHNEGNCSDVSICQNAEHACQKLTCSALSGTGLVPEGVLYNFGLIYSFAVSPGFCSHLGTERPDGNHMA